METAKCLPHNREYIDSMEMANETASIKGYRTS